MENGGLAAAGPPASPSVQVEDLTINEEVIETQAHPTLLGCVLRPRSP